MRFKKEVVLVLTILLVSILSSVAIAKNDKDTSDVFKTNMNSRDSNVDTSLKISKKKCDNEKRNCGGCDEGIQDREINADGSCGSWGKCLAKNVEIDDAYCKYSDDCLARAQEKSDKCVDDKTRIVERENLIYDCCSGCSFGDQRWITVRHDQCGDEERCKNGKCEQSEQKRSSLLGEVTRKDNQGGYSESSGRSSLTGDINSKKAAEDAKKLEDEQKARDNAVKELAKRLELEQKAREQVEATAAKKLAELQKLREDPYIKRQSDEEIGGDNKVKDSKDDKSGYMLISDDKDAKDDKDRLDEKTKVLNSNMNPIRVGESQDALGGASEGVVEFDDRINHGQDVQPLSIDQRGKGKDKSDYIGSVKTKEDKDTKTQGLDDTILIESIKSGDALDPKDSATRKAATDGLVDRSPDGEENIDVGLGVVDHVLKVEDKPMSMPSLLRESIKSKAQESKKKEEIEKTLTRIERIEEKDAKIIPEKIKHTNIKIKHENTERAVSVKKTKHEFKNTRDEVNTKINIELRPKRPLHNFTLFEEIPKSVAEHASEIKFSNKEFIVIEDDPLFAWHFEVVDSPIEISYVVEKEFADLPLSVPVAEEIGEELLEVEGSIFHITLPILIIPLLLVVYVFFSRFAVHPTEE